MPFITLSPEEEIPILHVFSELKKNTGSWKYNADFNFQSCETSDECEEALLPRGWV